MQVTSKLVAPVPVPQPEPQVHITLQLSRKQADALANVIMGKLDWGSTDVSDELAALHSALRWPEAS